MAGQQEDIELGTITYVFPAIPGPSHAAADSNTEDNSVDNHAEVSAQVSHDSTPWPFFDMFLETLSEDPPESPSDPHHPSWLNPPLSPLEKLSIAILENAHEEVLRLLSEEESHLELKDEHGFNLLHLATHSRHKKCLQAILHVAATHAAQGDPEEGNILHEVLNGKDAKNEETALHMAARIGWFEGVCLLVDAKADITATDKNGKTVLHLALSPKKPQKTMAAQKESVDILKRLLKHEKCNEIIYKLDEKSLSPLFFGVMYGANQKNSNIEMVELLLKPEVDIHRDNIMEIKIALFNAVKTNQPQILQLLIDMAKNVFLNSELTECFPDVFVTDKLKGDAIALHRSVYNHAETGEQPSCDVSPTDASFDNKTVNVFHLAAKLKDHEVMRVLLSHLEQLRKDKMKLLGDVYNHLNTIAVCLNDFITSSGRSSTQIRISQSKVGEIDKKFKIVTESMLKDDELSKTWKQVTSLTGSTPKQNKVPADNDKRLTIQNNSEAILYLLNEKAKLLEEQKILAKDGSQMPDDVGRTIGERKKNISDIELKITQIDKSFKMLNVRFDGRLTPLQIACENSQREIIKLLIKAGADLTCAIADRPQTTLLDMIIHCVPSSVDLIREVFDSSIELKKEYVEVDFQALLLDNTEKHNFETINAFLSTGNKLEQQKLLEHPLVQSFLQLQWEKLKRSYFILISLYMIFVLSLNFLLYTRYTPATSWYTTSMVMTSVSLIFLILYIEISYFTHAFKIARMKQTTEMCIKACCYFITILLLIFPDLYREFAVIAVGLSLLEFIYLLSHIPWYGTYLLIFIEVASVYFTVILSFSFIIIQFMFVFMVLFTQNESPFNTVSNSLTKIFVMMTGELEYHALFETFPVDNVYSLYFVQLVMIVFILLVVTVLVNLLTAKAVTEVEHIDLIRIQATSMIIYDKVFFGECTYRRFIHDWFKVTKEKLVSCFNARFSPNSELLSEKWRIDSCVVLKLQLSVLDRSCSSVPIDDNVMNSIMNQGFINKEKIKKYWKQKQDAKYQYKINAKLLDGMKTIMEIALANQDVLYKIKSATYLPRIKSDQNLTTLPS